VTSSAGALPLNQWSHVVATLDQFGDATLYRSGVQVGYGTVPVPANITRSQNYLGKSPAGDPLWTGRMDDVALYQGPLSAADVAAHYVAGTTNNLPGTITNLNAA